ncbi:hypothetical protein AB0M43_18545 [Longispora sp. NPDC051575]|uniref:hypothetical protein n=1 Tax=Longispora sp. NPDC051575 TaxID=3154943 RepID=UPI003439660F
MSEKLTDALGGLTHDTESVLMPGAAAIRRRGARRTRRTAIMAGVAALAVVGGVAFGVSSFAGGERPAPPPPGTSTSASPSASPSPSASASPSRVPDPGPIPDGAMLRASDLKLGSAAADIDTETIAEYGAMTLSVCGGYPSEGQRAQTRRLSGHLALPDELERLGQGIVSTVQERVSIYRAGGAAAFLGEVREQVGRCPGVPGAGSGAWQILGSAGLGDDSVVLRNTKYVTYLPGKPGGEQQTYAVLVRIGDVVVVVADLGWETGAGHEPVLRQIAARAVERAAVLR